jgi:endonuclease-3
VVDSKQTIVAVIDQLAKRYGTPEPPSITDPFQMILWENVAYLLSDEKRELAYNELKRLVGLSPQAILAASHKDMLQVATLGGMRPPDRVEKLLTIAQLALQEMPGGTKAFLEQPPAAVRKALKKFPGIADPGADRIMLFSGVATKPTFDSNGLRVLQRLGFVTEQKAYAVAYRQAQAVFENGLPAPKRAERYISSFQLLRLHGQKTCKTNSPSCYSCPFQDWCAFV